MKYLIFLIGCFLLTGCHDNTNITALSKEYFKKENVIFNPQWTCCYIIPGGGCSGCITSGIHFLIENKEHFSHDQVKNVVVFTSVLSPKLLRRSLKDAKLEDFNFIIDTTNVYTVNFKEHIYHLIIYFENGKIIQVDKQSPETNALTKLVEHLNQQHNE